MESLARSIIGWMSTSFGTFMSAALLLKAGHFIEECCFQKYVWIGGISAVHGVLMKLVLCGMGSKAVVSEGILLSLLAGGLLAAAYMDAEKCWVYNYVWWWCLLSEILLFIVRIWKCGGMSATDVPGNLFIRQLGSFIIFVMLQHFLFEKMYGKADCYAFCICALAESIYGGGLFLFLLHMLIAVMLMAIVQIYRKNLMWNGKLRKPGAFIPYIVVAFWIIMLQQCSIVAAHNYA